MVPCLLKRSIDDPHLQHYQTNFLRHVESFRIALAIPSRHGLRGVASHHFAFGLPRRSCHALHGVASRHFAATFVLVAMDNDDMTTSVLAEALY